MKYKKRINVYCRQCKAWIDEDTVDFLDIEEDFEGRDLMTFRCPTCKTISKSLRRG